MRRERNSSRSTRQLSCDRALEARRKLVPRTHSRQKSKNVEGTIYKIMNITKFIAWFATLTGHEAPRMWQADLAASADCRDRLIRIPTGLGKTEGVLATWAFHRVH